MNPAAILGLLASLYEQVMQLMAENDALRKQLAETEWHPTTDE